MSCCCWVLCRPIPNHNFRILPGLDVDLVELGLVLPTLRLLEDRRGDREKGRLPPRPKLRLEDELPQRLWFRPQLVPSSRREGDGKGDEEEIDDEGDDMGLEVVVVSSMS